MAGSVAAGVQSITGNVAAGSVFAACQSAGNRVNPVQILLLLPVNGHVAISI